MHKAAGVFVLAIFFCLTAGAQATRTWVSGVGDDANPCSRTAPCKTYAGAISKTAAGGEIDTLDPGGFGAVTITKAITIDGGNLSGGILHSGSNGIVINAGPNDEVILRNLTINGAKTGANTRGIRFVSGAALIIENCVITGSTQRGISVEPVTPANVVISNSRVYDNVSNGIVILPGGGTPTVNVVIDNTRVTNNVNYGMYAGPGSVVTVRNSLLVQNGLVGLVADQSFGLTEVNVESSVISHNGSGVKVGPGASMVRLSDTTITSNTTSGFLFDGGTVLSYGNNRVTGNAGSNGPANGGAVPFNPQ